MQGGLHAPDTPREGLERYATAFWYAPVGIALLSVEADGSLLIAEANPKLAELLGRPREELVGGSARGFVVPDARDPSPFERLMAGELDTYTVELRYVPAGGAPRWGLVQVARGPQRGDGGAHIVAQLKDIDDRKRAEAELRASRDRLDEAERLARMGSFERWFDSGEVVWSDGLYRVLGYEPGAVEPSLELVRRLVHEDDRPVLDAHLREQRLEPRTFELRIVRPGGGEVVVEGTRHLVLDEARRPIGARGTLRDVTDQRHLERAFLEAERFGSMFEVAPIATVFVDLEAADWPVVEANQAVCELTGRARPDYVGRPVREMFEGARVPDALDAFLRSGDSSYEGRHRAARRDGDPVLVQLTAYRISVGTGASRHGVLHFRERGVWRQQPEAEVGEVSDRELEVLRLVAEGLGGAQIAARLHLSPETVKTHLKRLYAKLGVSDRAAAVAAGFRRGLLS